ncbi:MAG: RHS repeat domain-containing protein [Bacteroidales bacterium]
MSYLIEQTITKNNSYEKTKTQYKNWNNRIIEPEVISYAKNSLNYYDKIQFFNYDEKGNVLQYNLRDGSVFTYLWGYNKTYPVAEIKNATFNEVNAISPNIALLEAGNVGEQQRIRQSFPNAMITFFTFKPQIGITSQTDPNGITIYYEYDSFGRLKLIRDHDGHILKTYEYNYKK